MAPQLVVSSIWFINARAITMRQHINATPFLDWNIHVKVVFCCHSVKPTYIIVRSRHTHHTYRTYTLAYTVSHTHFPNQTFHMDLFGKYKFGEKNVINQRQYSSVKSLLRAIFCCLLHIPILIAYPWWFTWKWNLWRRKLISMKQVPSPVASQTHAYTNTLLWVT